MIKTVSLYTGSSYPKNDEDFKAVSIAETKKMAQLVGKHADLVFYGGGLYGHLKDVMEEVGAMGCKMKALISPAFFDPKELYPDYVDVVQVADDQVRTQMFLSADAHIVTPGGDGTICEAFFSHNNNLSNLFSGQAMKPVCLLNLDGYYDGLKNWFEQAAKVGYSNDERQKQLCFLSDANQIAKHLWPSAKP
jgi:predicted Rossmann-fold nucleotide-binding protein